MTKKAQVNLISSPQDLKKIVYTACRTCYSSIIPIEIWKSINYNGEDCCFNDSMVNEKILKLILKVMESGHYSTVEHACFTFTISGISRAAANQLTRHRHMSFSQQSLRYVEIKEDTELLEHIVSNNLKEKAEEIVGKYYVLTYCKEANSKLYWLEIMDFADNLYRYLRKIKNGAEPEDARNILGLGVKTNLVATLNLRELIHLCSERLCARAQREIRLMVKQMRDLALEQEPWLKPFLQPKCVKDGGCTELECCGFNQIREKKELRVM